MKPASKIIFSVADFLHVEVEVVVETWMCDTVHNLLHLFIVAAFFITQ